MSASHYTGMIVALRDSEKHPKVAL